MSMDIPQCEVISCPPVIKTPNAVQLIQVFNLVQGLSNDEMSFLSKYNIPRILRGEMDS